MGNFHRGNLLPLQFPHRRASPITTQILSEARASLLSLRKRKEMSMMTIHSSGHKSTVKTLRLSPEQLRVFLQTGETVRKIFEIGLQAYLANKTTDTVSTNRSK